MEAEQESPNRDNLKETERTPGTGGDHISTPHAQALPAEQSHIHPSHVKAQQRVKAEQVRQRRQAESTAKREEDEWTERMAAKARKKREKLQEKQKKERKETVRRMVEREAKTVYCSILNILY